MKNVLILTVAFGVLGLSACQQENGAGNGAGEASADISQTRPAGSGDGANDAAPVEQPAGEVHTGSGDITEIDGDRVTISHGPVESIGWPAMTMTFHGSSRMLQGLNIGDPVGFQFQQAGEQFVLTSIGRAQQ